MSDLAKIAAGAISGGLSLVGIPLQQQMQKDLMHENESINIEQWQRENEYNSPSAQMARLKAAGLNPDLAIAGSVDNTAAHSDVTSGTPQAPGAAAAVGNAIHNAQQAALVESQVELNKSQAENQEAQAKEHGANVKFKNESLPLMLDKLAKENNFTQQQIVESQARISELEMRCESMAKTIDLQNEQITNLQAERKKMFYETRKVAFEGDLVKKHVAFYDEEMNAIIDKYIADADLSRAHASSFRAQTHLLWSTMQAQVSWWNNHNTIEYYNAWKSREDYHYSQYLNAQIDLQLRFLPFQLMANMFGSAKFLKTDEDGNFVVGENGLPLLDKGYIGFTKMCDIATGFTTNVESLTRSFYNTTAGISNIRYGGAAHQLGFSPTQGQLPTQTSKHFEQPQHSQEYYRLLHQYNSLTPAQRSSKEGKALYKKLTSIE